MNKLYTFIIACLGLQTSTYSQQCQINASAFPAQIYCGQSTTLTANGIGSGTVILSENFNSGYGSGWSGTPGSTNFNNPCSPGDGTPHAWMGSSTSVPRTLTSASFDLTAATAGVTICFDMLFARQCSSCNAPCEGPDEPDEGVYLEYSTNNGATWTQIHYFNPNGGNDPQLTNWNNWCFQIPAAAITSNTRFRWHQTADSGADFDHWGIDNVHISQNDVNAEIVWGTPADSYYYSYGVGSSGGQHPVPVSPTTTTTYSVTITTGTGDQCHTSVTVNVVDPVYEVNFNTDPNPAVLCPGECVDITGTAVQVLDPGGIETYQNAELGAIVGTPYVPAIPFINPVATIGTINATMNINIQTLNSPTVLNDQILNICVRSLTVNPGFGCSGTSLADVSLVLVCPGGNQIILANTGQLSGNALTNMCFTTGGNAISSGSAPYTGSFAPFQPISGLTGCTSNGVWTLNVVGQNFQTCVPIGGVTGWSITFDDPPIHGPVTTAWSPTVGLSTPHTTPLTNPNNITNQACPTNSETYVLTVSNGVAGCRTQDFPLAITVDPCNGCIPPSISTTPLSTCVATTVNLLDAITGTASFTYHSSQAAAQNGTSPISGTVSTSGSYWVRAEDPSDPTCFTVREIIVSISSPADASFTFNDFCLGDVNGATNIATPGGTFTFNPASGDGATINATTGVISNGVSGTIYTVEYSLTGTCPSSTTQSVLVSGVTYTTAVVGESCGNDDGEIVITTTSGASPFTFSIDGGTTTQANGTFNNLSAQSYTVVVEDNTGCTATSTVIVPVIGGPAIDNVSSIDPTCNGTCDGSITATVSGGTLPYTFEWEDENGNPVGGNSASISNLCAGDYTLSVYDNVSGASCASTVTVTLTDPGVADASFTLTNFCAGATNAATNVVTPGGTFTFNPAPGDGATINATTGVIANGVGGTTYTVQYTTGGACPVSSTEQVQVYANPTPVITGNLTYCPGNSSVLNAGAGYTSYSWRNITTNTEVGTSQTFTTTAITVNVTVTDANGCSGTSPTVTISESNLITNNSTVFICPGETVTVHGNPVSTAGVYEETFPTNGGCDSLSRVTVTVRTVVQPVISGQLWYCEGQTSTLSTTPSNYTSYLWSTGSTQSTINTTTNQPITVTVVDVNGCSSTSNPVMLVHPPQAVINANPTSGTVPLTVNFANNSTGATSYDWYLQSIDTFSTVNVNDVYTYVYDSIGTYTVVLVAHSANCSDTAVVHIVVEDPVKPLDAHIPNVFTPNGDGINDFFTFDTSNATDLKVTIVNRWGNLVYESTDVNFKWDGRDMSGNPVTEGVYFFDYRVIGLLGEELSGHGFVTVER